MRINDIGGSCQCKELADAFAVVSGKGLDADAGQDAGEIGLPAPVSPDLADHRGTNPDRCSLLLEHSQLRADLSVPAIDRYEGSSVEDRSHATPRRRAAPSRDAASSSSAWVKGPSSASH